NEQCLVDFLRLGSSSADVNTFVRHYGLFHHGERVEHQSQWPVFVRTFVKQAFRATQEPHVLRLEEFLRGNQALLAIHETYEQIVREKLPRHIRKETFHTISLQLGRRLREASPYVRFERGHAIAGVMAATVLTALYVLTWKHFLQESPLHRCAKC